MIAKIKPGSSPGFILLRSYANRQIILNDCASVRSELVMVISPNRIFINHMADTDQHLQDNLHSILDLSKILDLDSQL